MTFYGSQCQRYNGTPVYFRLLRARRCTENAFGVLHFSLTHDPRHHPHDGGCSCTIFCLKIIPTTYAPSTPIGQEDLLLAPLFLAGDRVVIEVDSCNVFEQMLMQSSF